MRTVELEQANGNLEALALEAEKAPLILTKDGKPVAALIAIDEFDLELLATAENPNFLAIMERSQAKYEKEGGISTEEMRRQLGLPRNP